MKRAARVLLAVGFAPCAGCGDDPSSAAESSAAETGGGTVGLTLTVTSTATGSDEGTASGDAGTGTSVEGGSSSTDRASAGTGDSTTGGPDYVDPRGYTLVAPMQSRFTYLFDADGQEINAWESDMLPANAAYLLENGHLLRVGQDPTPAVELVSGAGGILEEFDWDGNVVWQYEYTGDDIVAHHDIHKLPSGNVVIIAYEMFSVDEAIQAGRDAATLSPDGLWADHLVEVDPDDDTIVWEWHVWDHLVQDFDAQVDNYGVVNEHPERIDVNWLHPGDPLLPRWTHINAVAYNAELDQLVLSPRSFSEIWIIDHSTTTAEAASTSGGAVGKGGDLLYRWGNPAAWKAGDAADRELYFQHNPHWLGAGMPTPGNLLVFDNGDPMLRPWSRVVEIEPPLLPDGSYELVGPHYGPSEPVWTYDPQPSFFAAYISGADRLADGRTVVCDGPFGRIFEVTEAGDEVWAYHVPSSIFRAERYEADYPAWIGLTAEQLAPKGPLMVVPGG